MAMRDFTWRNLTSSVYKRETGDELPSGVYASAAIDQHIIVRAEAWHEHERHARARGVWCLASTRSARARRSRARRTSYLVK